MRAHDQRFSDELCDGVRAMCAHAPAARPSIGDVVRAAEAGAQGRPVGLAPPAQPTSSPRAAGRKRAGSKKKKKAPAAAAAAAAAAPGPESSDLLGMF
jgi:hypothetical protein